MTNSIETKIKPIVLPSLILEDGSRPKYIVTEGFNGKNIICHGDDPTKVVKEAEVLLSKSEYDPVLLYNGEPDRYCFVPMSA